MDSGQLLVNRPHNKSKSSLTTDHRQLTTAFTLVELLVVIAIIGVLIALLLPAVQAAREAARRSQCSNHIKQIGIAVHNFHSALGGLPPLSLGQAKPSFFVVIMPYLEQQANYELCQGPTNNYPDLTTPGASGWWMATLTEAQRNGFGSIPFFQCPSRRSGVQIINDNSDFASYGSLLHAGPLADYSVCMHGINAAGYSGGTSEWMTHFNPSFSQAAWPQNHYVHQAGPLRCALWASTSVASWMPRDSFSWWADGTSNQIVLGEKHVPPAALKFCVRISSNYDSCHDCSFLGITGGSAEYSVGRRVGGQDRTLARSPTDYDERVRQTNGSTPNAAGPGAAYSFGSYHPGLCHFLLGDGSVRAVPVTTPANQLWTTTQRPDILVSLCIVNDGFSVAIPQL